jgi:hypothetical protein
VLLACKGTAHAVVVSEHTPSLPGPLNDCCRTVISARVVVPHGASASRTNSGVEEGRAARLSFGNWRGASDCLAVVSCHDARQFAPPPSNHSNMLGHRCFSGAEQSYAAQGSSFAMRAAHISQSLGPLRAQRGWLKRARRRSDS